MATDSMEYRDAVHVALEMGRGLVDGSGMVGFGVAELFDGDGKRRLIVPFANLITDQGDLYTAQKVIAAIQPANAAAPTAANGMKLGTAATAVAKSGGGSFIGTFVSGSNVAFDASYPQTSNLGAGLGVVAVYKTTWPAGTATNSTINEATIVTDQATATAGSAATTLARTVFGTTINKGASDLLSLTWNWKYLGA